jgi:hypothetical protein
VVLSPGPTILELMFNDKFARCDWPEMNMFGPSLLVAPTSPKLRGAPGGLTISDCPRIGERDCSQRPAYRDTSLTILLPEGFPAIIAETMHAS